MSGKLFWQIVLLMVIGALLASVVKCGLMHYRWGAWGKHLQTQPPGMQQK